MLYNMDPGADRENCPIVRIQIFGTFDVFLGEQSLARYRKVALRLKNILEEYGVGGIVESVNGKRRLVPERVRCHLYDYLSGREEYAKLFKGSYLTNYSWGENTLAELTGEYLSVGEEK